MRHSLPYIPQSLYGTDNPTPAPTRAPWGTLVSNPSSGFQPTFTRQAPTRSPVRAAPVSSSGTQSSASSGGNGGDGADLSPGIVAALTVGITLGVLIVGTFMAFVIYSCEVDERNRRQRQAAADAAAAAAVRRRVNGSRPQSTAATGPRRTRHMTVQRVEEARLIKSMTTSQRRAYVKNFLRTEKFSNALKTRIGTSGRFMVSQSQRHLSPQSSSSPTTLCAICLEEFAAGEDICISQTKHCPHQYHLSCAFEWLMAHQECPCCRRDYLTIGQGISSHGVVADGAPVATTTVRPPTARTPTAPYEDSSTDMLTDYRFLLTALDEMRDLADHSFTTVVEEPTQNEDECSDSDECASSSGGYCPGGGADDSGGGGGGDDGGGGGD